MEVETSLSIMQRIIFVVFLSFTFVASANVNQCTNLGGKCIAASEPCSEKIPLMSWACAWNVMAWQCCREEPECGQPDIEAKDPTVDDWRIIYGNRAIKGSWPWQVSLKLGGNHFCGASIIDEYWVLSAAHCFMTFDVPYQYLEVVVGEHAQHLYERTKKVYAAESIFVHGDYNNDYPDSPNDIALIKLREPIKFNGHVKKVCLPEKSHRRGKFEGEEECWITGWGESKGTADERYLQQLKHRTLYEKECRRVWGWIHPDTICIGNKYQNACTGDSGGPLVCKLGNRFYQAGITSHGHKTCQILPSVYTRLTAFLDWIEAIRDYQGKHPDTRGFVDITL